MFNIFILIFTLLVILTAFYLKINRTAYTIIGLYLIYLVFNFLSSDQDPKLELKKKETLQVEIKDSTLFTQSIQDEKLHNPKVDSTSISVPIKKEHGLKVRSLKIGNGINIEERKPLGVDSVFTLFNEDYLFCFTGIKNSTEKVQNIFHIWEFNKQVEASILMNISPSPFWRCWSKKQIKTHQKGIWNVKIADINGMILEKTSIRIQ
jgi:hypothetical protein